MNGAATIDRIEQTGKIFIKENARLTQQMQAEEREIAAIKRRSFPDMPIGSFSTEREAHLAQSRALAERRAPLLAACRARLRVVDLEQRELGERRDAEVAALRLQYALGTVLPVVDLPPLDLDDDRLTHLRRTREEVAVQRDAADTARAACADTAQATITHARELAALAVTKECRPGEFAAARQAADAAAAGVARADEHLLAVHDALERVEHEMGARARQLQDAWTRARLVEYRESLERFAASLRSAAVESLRLRRLHDAIDAVAPGAAPITVPTVFVDLENPYNSIRNWMDQVADSGVLTKEGVHDEQTR